MKINNKKHHINFIFFCLILAMTPACQSPTKLENKTTTEQHWQELSSGLWQSNTGEIGFQTSAMHESFDKPHTIYITRMFLDGDYQSLHKVIDIDSFHQLKDSTYYQDKNHIYRYYGMAGGGTFSIFSEADYDSFEVLNDCFSKDNQQIFHWRDNHPLGHQYDYASFKTCVDCGCVAKDKNTYYVIGQELKQAEVNKMIADPKTYKTTRKALQFLQKK